MSWRVAKVGLPDLEPSLLVFAFRFDVQVVQDADRSILQVKQRWAHRFDLTREKMLIFKKLLQKMEQKFACV